jgi:hypothetical protein
VSESVDIDRAQVKALGALMRWHRQLVDTGQRRTPTSKRGANPAHATAPRAAHHIDKIAQR